MSNIPYLPLYTGDWKKDPELSLCSPSTRGIWIDLLCSLHDARIGQITGTPEQLARLCRCDSGSMHLALEELQSTGAANVSKRDESYTVICRRMKKAEDISRKRAIAGSKGGSKRETRPDTENDIDCLEVLKKFCVEIGLPVSDAESCFYKWQGNNWTNGGKPIRDWRSTIRSWKCAGYLPSQRLTGKNVSSSGHYKSRAAPVVLDNRSPEQVKADAIRAREMVEALRVKLTK